MDPNALDPTPTPEPTPSPARNVAWIFLLAGFVAVVGLVSWRANERARATEAATAAATQSIKSAHVVHIAVEGMTCAGCADNVATELEKVPGVASCTVSLDKKLAEVRLTNGDVAPATLVAAVQDAGYTARIEP